MELPLEYSYTSSLLRVFPVDLGPNIFMSIVLTSNSTDIIEVGFTREDSFQVPLGYRNAAKLVKFTIQAIWDLLATKNTMIDSLKNDLIKVRLSIIADEKFVDRRMRMYKSLIDKNIPIFEKSEAHPYQYCKTTITNSTIVIFIQRR
jgi:hypothetical protein